MTRSINTVEMNALRAWLKTARESQGLSMRALADRLDQPHSYVQRVEEGERRLDVVEFIWYCRALGLNALDGVREILKASDQD